MYDSSRYAIITASKSRPTDNSRLILITAKSVPSHPHNWLHRPLMMDDELIHKARLTGVTQGRVMLQREIKLLISK